MPDFDIIVIGAGPAGSAAATWAAKGGARVALLDKSSFPRNKLCGGLFTERSRAYYREIFGQDYDLSRAVVLQYGGGLCQFALRACDASSGRFGTLQIAAVSS